MPRPSERLGRSPAAATSYLPGDGNPDSSHTPTHLGRFRRREAQNQGVLWACSPAGTMMTMIKAGEHAYI